MSRNRRGRYAQDANNYRRSRLSLQLRIFLREDFILCGVGN